MPIPDQSKLLSTIDDLLSQAIDRLEQAVSEAQEVFDELPEDTQTSPDGEAVETYISSLQEALDATEAARGELPTDGEIPTEEPTA